MEERSMERREREPYALEKEREVREQDARIAVTDARAREVRATDPMDELVEVRALQSKLKESVAQLKHRDAAHWETIRSDVEEALATVVAALDEINARLDELEQAEGERTEAGRRPRARSHL
jgi:hypothetical protein